MAESTNQNPQTDYKFLDLAGLQKVWSKIKSNFTSKDELSQEMTNVYDKIGVLEESMANTAISSVDDRTIVATDGGKISAALGIRLNEDKQEVELYATGKNAESDGKEVLGSFSYTKFVKDGMLENVELVAVADGENGESTQAPGTYLKFTFNTDSGSSVIYVPVDDLVNIYTGSDYISVSGDVISLKKDVLTEDLKATFMTVEEFNNFKTAYDERVESVDNSLKSNSEAIAALQAALGLVETNVAESIKSINDTLDILQPEVAKNTSDISILSGDVETINENIEANRSSINDLLSSLNLKASQESVDGLTERVSDVESAIDEIEERIAELGQVVGPDGELINIHVSQISGLDPISDESIEDVCTI